MGGFVRVPYNDAAAIERIGESNSSVVAILLEVLQGEGGIHVADNAYLRKLREICDRREWLLMIDEVQSGIGRTGKWFAHQWAGIVPDVMPLAKGLGSGVPIGACLARGAAAKVFKPGNHGTTFGGGPFVSSACDHRRWKSSSATGLVEHAGPRGPPSSWKDSSASSTASPGVKEVRGKGLMIGIELDRPVRRHRASLPRGGARRERHRRQGRPPACRRSCISEAEAKQLVVDPRARS
jgi:acetylornithine aminotransferase